jgi:hypothetical protein
MRSPRFVFAAVVIALLASSPTVAENRGAYLELLREICAADCMEPRDALRTVRRHGRGATKDVALIMDVADVTMWDDKYLLHTELPQAFDLDPELLGNQAFGSRTPALSRPVTAPNTIVVELDEDTFFALLNVPTPREQAAMKAAQDEKAGIIVKRDRPRNFTRPTLAQLRETFRNRRIVVRGTPRLEAVFVGARLDHRRPKLFVEVDNADHLAFLPRYDKNGEPIFDGPLESLRADYGAGAG